MFPGMLIEDLARAHRHDLLEQAACSRLVRAARDASRAQRPVRSHRWGILARLNPTSRLRDFVGRAVSNMVIARGLVAHRRVMSRRPATSWAMCGGMPCVI